MNNVIHLKTPISVDDLLNLKIGDVTFISGVIFALRDEAEKRIYQRLSKGKDLPMDLKNAVVFHSGPIVKRIDNDWKVIALGPTTTARTGVILTKVISLTGIRGIIGKGGIASKHIKDMKSRCVYFSFPGGAAAVGSAATIKVIRRYWQDLLEPVWELEVKNLGPLVVAIDIHGNNLYDLILRKARSQLTRILNKLK